MFNAQKNLSVSICHRRQKGTVEVPRRSAEAAPLADTDRARKNSSTPVVSDTTAEKGAADKSKATTNRNLAQGKGSDDVRTVTSYFDPVWNAVNTMDSESDCGNW